MTEAAGLEPADDVSRLRASNALPFQLGHASRGGRRGSRTPKISRPSRFRDGIPRRWQSFQMVTPAGFQPALPRVRAGSSPLSYGAVFRVQSPLRPGREAAGFRVSSRGVRLPLGDRTPAERQNSVVGRNRTCDAPRFRRALYRLSFDHMRWARLDSNQQSLVCKTSALSRLSYSPASIEGGSRTLMGVAHGALDAARLPFRHLDAT